MGLFDLFKKKEKLGCCCDKNYGNENIVNKDKDDIGTKQTGIKILGSGCDKCLELESNTKKAVEELGLDVKISHITDFVEIGKYGVMTTPALVLDEKVLSYGKVLSIQEIKELLKSNLKGI